MARLPPVIRSALRLSTLPSVPALTQTSFPSKFLLVPPSPPISSRRQPLRVPPPRRRGEPVPGAGGAGGLRHGGHGATRGPGGAFCVASIPCSCLSLSLRVALLNHQRTVSSPPPPQARQDGNFFVDKPPPHIRSLPANLLDALRALDKDVHIRTALGACSLLYLTPFFLTFPHQFTMPLHLLPQATSLWIPTWMWR